MDPLPWILFAESLIRAPRRGPVIATVKGAGNVDITSAMVYATETLQEICSLG